MWLQTDNPLLVQLMVVFGADMNACNDNKETARHKAATKKNSTNRLWRAFGLDFILISVQHFVFCLPSFSSLKITNCSFWYTSPGLWNQLHASFRQPHLTNSHSTHLGLSVPSSPLSPVQTQNILSTNPSHHHRPAAMHHTAFTDSGLLNRFILVFPLSYLFGMCVCVCVTTLSF